MPIIVLTKKNLLIALLCVALLAGGIFLWLRFRDRPRGAQIASVMAQVENYELNVLPMKDRQLPVYGVGRGDNQIALTIDAAWDADKTPFILDTLDKYNIKATFFLCGVWVKQYPDFVKEIAKRGHEIGNHSLTHPHMSRMDSIAIQKELSDLDDMLEELTGRRSTLFRPPFGEYNDTVIKAAHEAGYEVIQWSRDTVDWKQDRSAQTILDGVLKKLQSGDIILCHNNGYKIETYLPVLIETAQQKGFRFVTVSELLLSGETSIDSNGIQQAKKRP
ncbi:MAG: polysaccharide deacetylase family protein [Clostridia bacterium]|nr:polysaccharide deacetylase family protein [Clostridia bacterium]